jgi:hypothetical protein
MFIIPANYSQYSNIFIGRMNIQTIQHHFYGSTRNIIAGAALCYSIQNKRYIEAPLTILFPSIYAGYHLYKNKEHIADWVNIQRYK